MELFFVGADHEVTGSCHCVHVGEKWILIDYGMEQGGDAYENVPLPVKPSQIDYVIVTHAHIDHTGMLPKLYHDGFAGNVIATGASAQLCDLMLRDAAHIQMMEAEWRNKKEKRKSGEEPYEPLYTMEDAMGVIKKIVPYAYDRIYNLCEGVRFRFTDIGHLLGSASVELWVTENGVERKLVFSGDIGNVNQPILNDPKYTSEADYVIMESTYGDRLHEKTRTNYVEELVEILRETFTRGGNVVIPAFAVGRTQVMLYFIREIKQKNLLPEFPDFQVFVDSPMAVGATEIFTEADRSYFDDETRAILDSGVNPISFKGLELSISTDDSKAINMNENPKVIISASGMCDAGRIKHHLKYNLWRRDSTVVFVGYQAEGTLGRKLTEGESKVKIFGEDISVLCRIVQLQGMSGHADKDGLIGWLKAFEKKPQKVFVVHGDDEVTVSFSDCLREEHGYDAQAPYSGSEFDLISGTWINEAQGIAIKKQEGGRESDAFKKLKSTGRALEETIAGSRGMANKDLDRFNEELQALIAKYKIDTASEETAK
ncbi:MAG: MBL fold metallo-hydrolase [Lachnospiraceae bacterium]|nr:MBL fold metallo-hydrolase [Lachnospiraceae bacterium]